MTTSVLSFDWARHGLLQPTARTPIPGGPQSVAHVLRPLLRADPDGEGLVGAAGRYTWSQLDSAANRAAHALSSLGIGRFDRVGVSLPNDADIVIAFLAAMRLGAIWVGIGRQLAPPEKRYILTDAGCRILLADADVAAGLDRNAPADGVGVVELDRWRRLVETQPAHPVSAEEPDPHQPAAIAYTSGTTGVPKGVVHSQHNLMVYGAAAREANLFGPGLHAGVQLPLTVLNLFVIQVLHAFQNSGKCVCINAKSAIDFARAISGERIAHIATVPTIYHDLVAHPEVRAQELSSVRLAEIGGTNVPTDLLSAFNTRFGIQPRVSYGMTEAPAAVARVREGEEPEPGLVGVALPQIAVSVHDEGGRAVSPGTEGEIWVGPSVDGPMAGVYTTTLGYWNRPEATRAALRDGSYRTGDMGVIDERGRLFVSGRHSELIIRGGANVHPAEVERVLGRIDGVRAAAVFGMPDERLGERVVAVVELEADSALTVEEIRTRCAEDLARYKVPDRIAVTDQLPRNAMQKVMKAKLTSFFD